MADICSEPYREIEICLTCAPFARQPNGSLGQCADDFALAISSGDARARQGRFDLAEQHFRLFARRFSLVARDGLAAQHLQPGGQPRLHWCAASLDPP
eukprot:3152642-Pleurochrysis_carterae.AAC.1